MSDRICEKQHVAVRNVTDYLRYFLADPTAFRGQQLRGGGPVAEFEQLLAERCGFPFCVATCNATTALLGLALIIHARGRTVLFPRDHWEGSVAAFRLMGAKIRRYNPPRKQTDSVASDDPVVATIVGQSDDFKATRIHASGLGRLVIEDSGRIPGISAAIGHESRSDIQVLSFGPGKPLCLGEGGAVLFRDERLYEQFVRSTQHPERVASEFGRPAKTPDVCLNGRIHPLAALIGIEFLRKNNPH